MRLKTNKFASTLRLIPWLLLLIPIGSCRKDDFLEDEEVNLEFSDKEIVFDTVFVSIGSTTKFLKIYNTYNRPLRTNISMAGNGVNFRMNVNGQPGRNFKNVEIRAKDSLWIFVEVTVDPGSGNLPFILKDSIIFETNGKIQDVDLRAWGQNAHFFVADKVLNIKNSQGTTIGQIPYTVIDTNQNAQYTWDNTLPYVIYGGFLVVDSSQVLNITEGTQIHFYNSSGLWVYKGGTLKVKGTKEKPVVFQGMRREADYADEPGQWDRIWINDGGINEIDYAVIKNGFIGLQTETLLQPGMPQQLYVSNTIIKNMSGFGMLTRNFKVKGWNNVIANCGSYCAAFTEGGDYEFIHCTFANYWNLQQRSTPSIYINNYEVSGSTLIANPLNQCAFKNSIITGTQDDELTLDTITHPTLNYEFNHCIIKAKDTNTSNAHFVAICRNCNPDFANTDENNYELGSGSAALNIGDFNFVIPDTTLLDIKGVSRNNPPDLGAYEK